MPVVDYGDDLCWHGGVSGLPFYRNEPAVELFRGSRQGDNTVDVSGKGTPERDSVAYYEFSMERPLSPSGSFYNTKGNNTRFYGGAVTYWANRRPRWAEGGINIDHELRDDFNLHSYATEGGDVGLRTFGLWLWRKDDFINGGAAHRVSSDEASRIAVYVSRYWKDYEEARFVVQDGERFFISEHAFGGKTHTLYEVRLAETRWAAYEPRAPHAIEFDPKGARFETRRFADIRAAGWYVAKPTLGPASLWLKWYAFNLDAVVEARAAPSRRIEMVRAASGAAVSARPVSYAEWRGVYAWANRNQYGLHAGHVFDEDGDMGDMRRSGAPRSAADSVTRITWHDAAVWCNALSTLEGLEPVFYSDAGLSEPLRAALDRQRPGREQERPEIFVKWNAAGFRPAMEAERPRGADGFFVARGGAAPAHAAAVMAEWAKRHVVEDVAAIAGAPQGLRMVSIPGGTYQRRDGARVSIRPFALAATETTFAQWKSVHAWALGRGYRFDRGGDLGSMDWSDAGAVFTQDEPVTQVSHLDVMLWCNALSEIEGRTPVYYADEAGTEVLKAARRFRIENTEKGPAVYHLSDQGVQAVHVRWDADGYRMPTRWEWEFAYRAGNDAADGYPWGNDGAPTDHAWIGENSGDKTRPVGGRRANALGLHDMAGNVFEWTLGGGESYYLRDNPRGEGMPVALGGSFRTADAEVRELLRAGGAPRVAIKSPLARAYPEIGFRVARDEKGVHPREAPAYVPARVLELDPTRLDAN